MDVIKILILRYLRDSITATEQAELDQWLAASDANRLLLSEFTDPDQLAGSLDKMDQLHEEQVWERLLAYGNKNSTIPVSRTPFIRRFRWAAAAIFILILGSGAWLWHHQRELSIAISAKNKNNSLPDIAPGKTRAILTLADGRQIPVDSMPAGTLAIQGGSTIHNSAGALTYAGSGKGNGSHDAGNLYNTLTTGRGERSPALTLSDGTIVWLNAASSVRYPVTFTGHDREVSITGEAYLEVAKNTKMSFTAITNGMRVEVLGTHFNVNGYKDEAYTRATLLEGSVRVTNGRQSAILSPGQQAQGLPEDPAGSAGPAALKIVKEADLRQVMAWKSGMFYFGDRTGITTIMREIGRWYDVEIVYDGLITQHFSGSLPRDVPLSQVLRVLQATGNIKCRIDGKKLILSP